MNPLVCSWKVGVVARYSCLFCRKTYHDKVLSSDHQTDCDYNTMNQDPWDLNRLHEYYLVLVHDRSLEWSGISKDIRDNERTWHHQAACHCIPNHPQSSLLILNQPWSTINPWIVLIRWQDQSLGSSSNFAPLQLHPPCTPGRRGLWGRAERVREKMAAERDGAAEHAMGPGAARLGGLVKRLDVGVTP